MASPVIERIVTGFQEAMTSVSTCLFRVLSHEVAA